jgi:hypothetical protein
MDFISSIFFSCQANAILEEAIRSKAFNGASMIVGINAANGINANET